MYKFNKAELLENGIIQLREIEVLELADGTTRDGGFRRRIFTPDTDIDLIDCNRCKAMAQAAWTQEVKESYILSIQNQTV